MEIVRLKDLKTQEKLIFTTVFPILVRKLRIVCKADGGIKLKSIGSATETLTLKMAKSRDDEAQDERTRNDNENAIYRRTELELTPVSVPVTWQGVQLDGTTGVNTEAAIGNEDLHTKWGQVENFFRRALMLTVDIGQFEMFRNVLSSQYQKMQIPVKGSTEENFSLTVLQDIAGSSWQYNEYFSERVQNQQAVYNGTSIEQLMVERRIELTDSEGVLQDLEFEATFRAIADVEFPFLNTGK